jgi:actin-like ATPase involved in cell morphogenesis
MNLAKMLFNNLED